MNLKRAGGIATVLLVAAGATAGDAHALVIQVTAPTDNGNTTTLGSLSAAIAAADAAPGSTINLVAPSIALSGTLPNLTASTTITGTTALGGSSIASSGLNVATGTLQIGETGSTGSFTGSSATDTSGAGVTLASGTGLTVVTGSSVFGGTTEVASTDGGAGVVVSAPGAAATIGNAGTISGGAGGITGAFAGGGNGVTASGNLALTNSGLIKGGQGGGVSGAGGFGGTGIAASAVGTQIILTNQTGGTIEGGVGGVIGSGDINGTGITTTGSVKIVNQAGASILGDQTGVSGVNSSGGTAIKARSGASITNAGTIAGTGGYFAGVGISGTGVSIVNQAGGLIEGGNGTEGGSGGAAIAGDGLTITDAGTIQGGKADAGAGAQADAIGLSGGDNTLTLEAGYNIIGTVAASGGADILALGGSTSAGFDMTALGPSAQFRNFGGFMLDGSATWTLTGTNTAALPIDLASGVLAVGADAELGSGALVFTGGTLQLDSSFTFSPSRAVFLGTGGGTIDTNGFTTTIAQPIAGNGGLTVASSGGASGTLILAGANTYAGNTSITSGTLRIGAGGASGSIASPAILVASGASLSFDRSGTLTYDGTISGAGALLQQGSGTVILNGSDSSFTGPTTVQSGTLEVGDAGHAGAVLGGQVTVAAGASLMGHGTIAGGVSNDGTLRPGGSIGVLRVAGNYVQASTGTLAIEITPDVAGGPGVGYDQLSVGGTATLSGGTLNVIDDAGTYSAGSRYTVLTAAGGVSGTFATASYNPAFATYITPVLSYDANNVYLTLNPTSALANTGQQAPDMLTALLTTAAGVGEAVLSDACSPKALHNVTSSRECVVHALAAGYRTEVWMRGLGGLGNLTGGGARFGFHDSYGGVLLGGGISRGGFTVGLGGGYVATTLGFSDTSSASQNAGVGFVYGRYVQGPLSLGATVAYGGGQIDGKRVMPGTGLAASGNRSGNFTLVQGRATYDLALGVLTLQPRASLAYIHAGQSGFAESGAGLLDLTYAGTSTDEVDGRLTARAMRSFAVDSWVVAPWAEAGVQQTFSGLSRGAVVEDGALSAGASGVSPAPTAGLVGVGVDAAASDRLDLFLRYQGLLSANQTNNAFSAGLTMQF